MSKIKKNIHIYIITIFVVIFNLIILIFPKEIMNSVKNGLILWFNFVLPALLPFMISINLLKATPFPSLLSRLLGPVTNRIFGVSSFGIFAIVSGMLSGYPLGAKLVSELYSEKKLTKGEAQYLLSFTNNSGPLFIAGTVGTGLLKSNTAGFFLLIIHYISALSIGILLPKPKGKITGLSQTNSLNIGKELKNSIYNGIEAIVLVGGYIIFFSIICTILQSVLAQFNLNIFLKAIIFGILEITNGCKELTEISRLSLSIISAIIAFGGLSIHSQSIGYISSTDLSSVKYVFSKFIQGILAFIICFLLYPLYTQQGCR